MDLLKRIAGKPLGLASSALQGAADIPQSLYGLTRGGIKGLTGYEIGPEQLSLPKGSPLGGIINLARGRNPNEQVPVPGGRELKENIIDPLAERTIGKRYLEPQNTFEEIAQSAARSALPIAATGGLSSIPAAATSIGRELSSSAAMKGAESLGFGALGQALAGIGTSAGFNKFINRLNKNPIEPRTLNKIAQEEKTKFYTKEKELGSKIKLPATELEQKLPTLRDKINRDISISASDRNEFNRVIEELSGDIVGRKIPASTLVERRRQLNNILDKTTDRDLKRYFSEIKDPLKNAIEKNRSAHPEWSQALKSADNIHNAQNFTNYFARKAEEYPKITKVLKNPLAYGIASTLPALFFTRDPLQTIGLSIVGATGAGLLKKGAEISGFLTNTDAPKVLMKASSELLNNNIPAALSSYHKLDKMADSYEKKQNKSIKEYAEKKSKAREGLVRRGSTQQPKGTSTSVAKKRRIIQ